MSFQYLVKPYLTIIISGGIGLLSKFVSIIREAILGHYPVQHVESSLYTVELVFLLLGKLSNFYRSNVKA